MADESEPTAPPLIFQEPSQRYNRAEGFDGLLWTAQQGMRNEIANQGATLADHGGQLKTIPSIAAAIQQNFAIWFAVIAIVSALIVAGFAFLGAYQVSNNQMLSDHSVKLEAQSGSIDRIEDDVTQVRNTLDRVSADVARLADDAERAPAGQAKR